MTYQMDLHNHYKEVRARLNAGPKLKIAPPEPEPVVEPVPEPVPALEYLKPLPTVDLMRGFMGSIETRLEIQSILEKYNITWRNICEKNRKEEFVRIRAEIYVTLNANDWSLKRIGNLIGKRDHTTVLSSIQRFVKSYMTEAELEMCALSDMIPVRYCYEKLRIKENEKA